MQQSNKQIENLDHVEDKVFFINRCDFTVSDFFTQLLEGSVVEDDCVLTYKDKTFDIKMVYEVGVILQRDISIYRLIEYNIRPWRRSESST